MSSFCSGHAGPTMISASSSNNCYKLAQRRSFRRSSTTTHWCYHQAFIMNFCWRRLPIFVALNTLCSWIAFIFLVAISGGRSSHRANDDAANSAMHALQRKAEKKKEKKKRKKEKRKNNEKSDNKFISNNGKIKEDSDCSSCEHDGELEEEQLDFNSAFVSYGGRKSSFPSNDTTNGGAVRKPVPDNKAAEMDPEILRSRQLQARSMAVQGNEAAAHGQHQKAVKLFTQAVIYDPNDHRFLGNRSFCYEQLKQFDKALSDADKAIELSPEWPKGYFRRGRALLGLAQLTDAEEAFSRVLQLDPECQEAQEEISNVRRFRLMEMGFTDAQAMQAIAKYRHVQAALDALLSGEFHDATATIFYSEGEDELEPQHAETRVVIPASTLQQQQPKKPTHAEDIKMNPRNPQGLTSLWVGNVLPDVTEKELQKLFSKYGHVSSVRQLKEKFCAFVNFTDSSSAGRAMTGLQGHLVNNQRLLIKFPDNPINCTTIGGGGGARRRTGGGNTSSSSIKLSPESTAENLNGFSNGDHQDSAVGENGASKPKGPVHGDECYFWRTTGCAFPDTCRHKHLPQSKGIDRKPWQK